jgi:hypothetical protein
MHGGTITATSDGLGHGSEFVLALPVVVGWNSLKPGGATGSRRRAPANRVLVVDDNVDAADTLEALLTMEGFAVTVAYDGAAALEKAQSHAPDVVLMDIGMPRMDGYAARLRRPENVVLIRAGASRATKPAPTWRGLTTTSSNRWITTG